MRETLSFGSVKLCSAFSALATASLPLLSAILKTIYPDSKKAMMKPIRSLVVFLTFI